MALLPKGVLSIMCIFDAALLTLKQIKVAIRKSGKHLTHTTTYYLLRSQIRLWLKNSLLEWLRR